MQKSFLQIGILVALAWLALSLDSRELALSQAITAQLVALNREGQLVNRLTDGNTIQLRLTLPEAASQDMRVSFSLDGSTAPLSECVIASGEDTCTSNPLVSLGWYWGSDGNPRGQCTIQAQILGQSQSASVSIEVSPRPVVMVHGFSSNWQAWERYLGEQGYLTGVGLRGFAVGDGQVEGVLNTGAIHQPTGRTNTIAQNADILGRYIDQVQALTGAEKVDLLAHSMGGLISRYYIDRVMQEDVAQLIMLGSPMAGTDCANLPASLGYYLPAVLEIQPSYVIGIFNQQITDRHGVPFHAIAGVPIIDPVASPCTPVPTDIAVSLDSVGAIPLNLVQTPVLHTELNTSEDVFTDSVLPLLRTPAGQFTAQADSSLPVNVLEAVPLNRVYTGHLDSGETADLAIQIEPGLSVASFALFDPTQSLTVTVYGASGNMIELDAQKNGLTVVDDPSALLHLGYGFANPKPGPWQIKLQTTERTPPGGADYAITAALRGGAVLEAQTNLLLPEVDQPVHITARLLLGGQVLPLETAEATVLAPDGGQLTLPLAPEMDQARVEWTPQSAGLHSLVVSVVGRLPDGSPVERVEFMTVEAQPEKGGSMLPIVLTLGGMAILFFLGVVGIVLLLVMLRRQKAN